MSCCFQVDAALAASAPIRMASQNTDYTFFRTITNDFAAAHSSCPDLVRAAFAESLQTAATGPAGLDALSKNVSRVFGCVACLLRCCRVVPFVLAAADDGGCQSPHAVGGQRIRFDRHV